MKSSSLTKRLAPVCLALLPLLSLPSASAAIIPYPRVPGDSPNPDYVSVKVNGIPVDAITTDMRVGYCHFALDGKATVQITAREPIRDFDLSPHRLGLDATVDGQVLTFELDGPRQLHLRINGLSRFFLFADPPESDPPRPGQPGVHSLSDYGVSSSPDLAQTAKIQQAIDAVASKKGILHVPPGIYRSGPLDLKSNLTLYLAPGAVIKGTGKAADYPRKRGGTQQMRMENAENVRIFGRGVIDGNGLALRRDGKNSTESRAKLITTLGSRGLAVDGVILREAAVWCVHMIESRDMRFSNIKLISMTRVEATDDFYENGAFYGSNTDGFDPDNSSHILIENSFISCDDDPIAVKLKSGSLRDMEDIQVRGNVIWTMCSALKIGTEIHQHKVTNVVFENNDIIHADRGIVVYCWRGGTVENARWINNHFESIGVLKNESPHKKESSIGVTIRNVEGHGAGHVRNLLIKDNTFERFSPNNSLLQGLDPGHTVDGVTIENLVIAGKKRVDPADAGMTVGRFVENVRFE